jgi:hypothetical protein
VEHLQGLANAMMLPALMQAHQSLQSERAQLDELCCWDGQGGTLEMAAESVCSFVRRVVLLTTKFAPESNPQARMVQLEMDMHLKAMKDTLRHCAIA